VCQPRRGKRQEFGRFDKGRHPASLDFGDCFAYALARVLGEPRLYQGNDFSQTDTAPFVVPSGC